MKSLKQMFKTAAATLLTAALCFGAVSPALADPLTPGDGATEITSFPLTKTINTDKNITALPDGIEFGYTVTSTDNAPVLIINPTSLKINDFSADTTASTNDVTVWKATANITFPTYTAAGLYTYTIEETTAKMPDDPWIWTNGTTNKYVVKVRVANGANGELIVDEVGISTDGVAPKSDKLVYTADLYKKATIDNNEALSISKTVAGSYGNREQYFDFTLTFTHQEGTTTAPADYPVTIEGATLYNNGTKITADENGVYKLNQTGTYTFKLKHGDTLKISGLPVGTKYTVSEDRVDRYDISATWNNYNYNNGASLTIVERNNTIAYTNTFDDKVNTGLFIDNLPFILLIALGVSGVAITLISRRRRYQG